MVNFNESGGIMKKIIISTILIIFCGCSTINYNKNDVYLSFIDTKNEFVKVVAENRKDIIDKFFVNSIKNNIILRNINNINLNDIFVFILENQIIVENYNKISTPIVLTYGTNSAYFVVVWKNYDGMWKIYDIYEKQN